MATREDILNEIRRIADKRGKPLGIQVFTNESGIKIAEWHGKFWRTWGDALCEAGFTPNEMQSALPESIILEKYAEITKSIGRIPTSIDLKMYGRENPDFPGHTTFSNRFPTKQALLQAFLRYVRTSDAHQDLVQLVESALPAVEDSSSERAVEGYVYLLKSGNHYKIGRSEDVERRIKQVATAMPERVVLEHVIKTDDPSGIEDYWHRRFASKRLNGEWFALDNEEVRAFKRRKFQ